MTTHPRFARYRLAHLPTPMEPMHRLQDALGGPRLLIKRDDCTGLAIGGNKTRKLEFLIAEALDAGATTVVTEGGMQSNHVRQTAAAAARAGLECELVVNHAVPWHDPAYASSGNLLLDRLLGARVHVCSPGQSRKDRANLVLADIRRAGGRPMFVPTGGSTPTGALGYVECAKEMARQAHVQGIGIDHVVLASSSGGTQAGIVAGHAALRSGTICHGVDVENEAAELRRTVTGIARATAGLLPGAPEIAASDIVVVDGYGAPEYGMPSDAMIEAVTLVARTEGILLDPVYAGKAMAGLIGMIRAGRFSKSETVVFIHTGGSPALFAYPGIFPAAGDREDR